MKGAVKSQKCANDSVRYHSLGYLERGLQQLSPTLPTWLADANRVRQNLPASGDGAAQPHQLRTVPRRYTRPPGQTKPPERTSEWIKVGGKVTWAFAIGTGTAWATAEAPRALESAGM